VMELPVTGGTWYDDNTAAVRRRADLTLSIDDWDRQVPGLTAQLDSGLWPIGNEIRLYQGLKYVDTSLMDEEVLIGVFRISRPRVQDDGNDLSVSMTVYDRSRTIGRARFTDPYSVKGDNAAEQIKLTLQRQCPWLTDEDFDFMYTDGSHGSSAFRLAPAVMLPGDNPWVKAVEMAKSIGADLYWRGDRCVLEQVPDYSSVEPVFNYVEGEDAIFTSVVRDLDDENVFNIVVLNGQNTHNDNTVGAIVWDDDPTSPTYYDPDHPEDSTYGAVPTFVTSEYVRNYAQAWAAANAIKENSLGIIESVAFNSVANFAHESNDVLRIKRSRANVDGLYVLESFSCDLGAEGSFQGTTRKRRLLI